jgi:hypothetical protein
MHAPKTVNGKRRYGAWAGSPDGQPEDRECCAAEISNYPNWADKQCTRKRGYGPGDEFCKQHAAKMTD